MAFNSLVRAKGLFEIGRVANTMTWINRYWRSLWKEVSSETGDERLQEVELATGKVVPMIWLLGKTAAGKSSIVKCVTGASEIEIGNGYRPCTRTADIFVYPPDQPLLKFLDTRGLGETGYDPAEDIRECMEHSHVVVAVAKLDDPNQQELCDVLKTVSRKARGTEILLVHTGKGCVPEEGERSRARAQVQDKVGKTVGREVPWIELELAGPTTAGKEEPLEDRDRLVDALSDLLKVPAFVLASHERSSAEGKEFSNHRNSVLWYAASAGASDTLPVVGAGSVIAAQSAMLVALGRRYEVEWTLPLLLQLKACLGTALLLRYGLNLGLRQFGKLIPVYGQTVGALAAGTISFAATYALGRAAAYFLFQVREGREVSPEELRALYKQAFQSGKNPENGRR